MPSIRRLVVPLIVVVVAAFVLWPHLDREASRVSMCVAGFGLVIAWYSILDLREQRQERVWPHTIDRLLRATFTAVTLVFVVDIVFTPAPEPPATPPTAQPPVQPPVAAHQPTFGEALLELVEKKQWTEPDVQRVVTTQLRGLRGADGTLYVDVPSGNHRISVAARGVGFESKVIR